MASGQLANASLKLEVILQENKQQKKNKEKCFRTYKSIAGNRNCIKGQLRSHVVRR